MTPLERAARDLCAEAFDGYNPDEIYRKAHENPCPSIPLQDGECDETIDGEHLLHLKYWRSYVPQVRAVLLAIREPSEGMILSGVKALSDSGVDEANLDDAKLCHLAMIDKALEEG